MNLKLKLYLTLKVVRSVRSTFLRKDNLYNVSSLLSVTVNFNSSLTFATGAISFVTTKTCWLDFLMELCITCRGRVR